MSRIGKAPIAIPSGVTVTVSKENVVTVKGPKGELKQVVDRDIKVEMVGEEIHVIRPTDQIRHKALHGLYRSLVANMVTGVTTSFKRNLELVGVGYRASNQGQTLELALGFSHNIVMSLAPEVKVEAVNEKGKNPIIKLTSHDKQLVGQIAAKIRGFRKPEPYKGKGIRYAGEVVRRKAGKTGKGGKK